MAGLPGRKRDSNVALGFVIVAVCKVVYCNFERSAKPIFTVEKAWEKVGQVPNEVFVEGMVRDGDRWPFYYGAADKQIGVATADSLPVTQTRNLRSR
jgi:predicted GH43/DUF377 family glycosyl hydrolase